MSFPVRLALASMLIVAFPPRARAQGTTTIFRDVRVFDGSTVIPSTSVVVRDGKILSVGPTTEAPEGATVVEGRGKTLLPGLIDAHTHTFAAEMLRQALAFGVTTELDMFTGHAFAATMRSEQKAGGAAGRADLFSAGTIVTAPGGHGTEYGLPVPTLTEPAQAEAFIAARIAEGSDYIKITYDDGHAVGLKWPTLRRETLAALIQAAHKQGKQAVVHVLAREPAREALTEGADGLVHLWIDQPIDPGLVRLAAEKKAFIIPTLTVLETIDGEGGATLAEDSDLKPLLTPADLRALRSGFPNRARPVGDAGPRFAYPLEAVRQLKAAGVTILAGTDAVNPGTAHGASIHRELELLVKAGLTPREALAAATSQNAERFGLTDRGRVAPGLRADLLLVAGDPTQEIKATRAIAGVWKAGRRFDGDAYRREVASLHEAQARARTQGPPRGSEAGLVSDFEEGVDKPKTQFGAGWMVSTDSFVGGKSQAAFAVVPEGARNSKGALKITGTIEDRDQPRWGGVTFSPGFYPMAPVNLSSKKAIAFRAKGDGKTYQVMLFFSANGYRPAMQSFVAGPDWSEHRFTLESFDGCDGTGLMGVFLGGGSEAGPFTLYVDDVRFE